ncbi:MAG: virulence RhuM family protein [Coriobacteriales bacterium]|nr:virulence RhuM family protein [Coriobacteriales bacterium]
MTLRDGTNTIFLAASAPRLGNDIKLHVDAQHQEVWLTRNQLAVLYGRDVKTIGKHINNALKEKLAEIQNRTVAKFATVQIEGDREVVRQVEHYSLDMILAVGYRVKSQRGIEFRRWATDAAESL